MTAPELQAVVRRAEAVAGACAALAEAADGPGGELARDGLRVILEDLHRDLGALADDLDAAP